MNYPLIASAASLMTATAAATETIPTPSQLASYGLTLPQFEQIKASESPYDFSHPTSQDQLWIDAAAYAYETSTSHAADNAGGGPLVTSLSYMPYIVCNTQPNLSGQERIQMITAVFDNTTEVTTSDYYNINTAAANGVDGTCILMRAYNDTMGLVYGQHENVESWLRISPLHQSMKMNNATVDIVKKRFENIESGDYILPSPSSDWFRYVNVLGSQSLLCPGVKDFGGVEVTDEDISKAVKEFIVRDNGQNVKEASFFHQRVNVDGGDTAADAADDASSSSITTDRMEMWASIINNVDNMTLPNGTNYCREIVITNNFLFVMDSFDTLNVYAKFSTDELLTLANANDLMLKDLEECVLYMIMGLALNPMICWVEPKNQVRVICPDGSLDLKTCPEPEGGGGSSSFSVYGRRRLGGSVVVSVLSMAVSLWSFFVST
eukprot:scaffold10101_cov55-Cyclotella_meneghiniana.AAC.3